MNDFTKEELIELCSRMTGNPGSLQFTDEAMTRLSHKIQSMIDNYWLPDNVDIVGTGQILFHNKYSESAIIPKIGKQLGLCENSDESKCFRIDWKIIYGNNRL